MISQGVNYFPYKYKNQSSMINTYVKNKGPELHCAPIINPKAVEAERKNSWVLMVK